MSGSRRVERLHLNVTRREHVGRATNLVQDALHTATLPPHRPGAVLLVRQLDVGTVWLNRSSQAPARRITEELRRLAAQAVPFTHARADGARAVWLEDLSEALAELSVRWVLGPAPHEWFWSALASHVELPRHLQRSVGEALAAVLAPPTLPNQPPKEWVASRTLEALIRRGQVRAVLSKLAPVPLATRRTRLHFSAAQEVPDREVVLKPVWRELLTWASVEWREPGDARLTWLALCGVAASYPGLSGSPHSARLVAAVLAQLHRSPSRAVEESTTPSAAQLSHPEQPRVEIPEQQPGSASLPPAYPDSKATSPHAKPLLREQESSLRLSGPMLVKDKQALEAPAPVTRDRVAQPAGPHRASLALPPPLTAPALTDFGGALFLIAVLRRMGLERWMESLPELVAQEFGVRVLYGLLDTVSCPELDPMRRALAPRDEPAPLEAFHFAAAPPWWPEVSDSMPWVLEPSEDGRHLVIRARTRHAPSSGALDTAQAHLQAWIEACCSICEKRYGISVMQVICRGALLSANETHVDVVFPISGLDIEVRRRGLDADPGWVPFLGRVVAFHYVEQEDWLRLVSEVPAPETPQTHSPVR